MRKIADILYKRPFLLLLLFLVVAYLPVFLPFFHLKNDLITQNLPTRYIIGESLYSGYFPWWNPYINFGIPQYGDMNNGFWNPVMWLIAKTIGYNIWTITYEEMFYILIGGWGIFKVARQLGIEKRIAIITALSYMSSGYIVGHLQYLCWITGTAFFPYVFLYFLKINNEPVFKNYILGGFTFFLFVASTHPGLIIGAAYFFLLAAIMILLFRNTYARNLYRPKFLLINMVFLLVSLVFSIGVVISNLDVLRHISRGTRVSLDESLLAPTTFQSYLSILFPIAVHKSSFFATDISMRNVFVGIPVLLGVIFLFRCLNRKALLVVVALLLFFVLLSSGGTFKTFFYYALPLVGYVRLNGEFTFFVSIILILAGAYGVQQLASESHVHFARKLVRFFIGVSVIAIIVAAFLILFPHSSIIYGGPSAARGFKLTAREVLAHLRFGDLLLISAVIQLGTFLLIAKNLTSTRRIAVTIIINLVVNTWLVLPFTDLGMKSKEQMHHEMIQGPRGLFAQELRPLRETASLDSTSRSDLLLLGSYSRKIGYPKEEQYPVELRTTLNYFNDTGLHAFISKQSYIFLSTDTSINAVTNFDSLKIRVDRFGPGYLSVKVTNDKFRFLTLLQNDYPYWQTFLNGKRVGHVTSFKTFISVPVERGTQQVVFEFRPALIRKAILINIAILLVGLLCLLVPQLRNRLLVS